MKRIEVGDHVFEVPERLVQADDLFFLPPSKERSLSAIIDADAPRERQLSVIVQTQAGACRSAVSEQVRTACAVASGQRTAPAGGGRLTRRQRHADDPTFYDYVREDGSVAISCSAAATGTGECTIVHAWRDLVWQFDFPEADVGRADAYRATVERKLDEWSGGKG